MRHLAPCLILLIVPVAAHASSEALTSSARPGCTYAPAETDRSATPATSLNSTPSGTTSKIAPSQRSGDDDLIPRTRSNSSQWHRFLPGMFR
jgi:hypothetical protein